MATFGKTTTGGAGAQVTVDTKFASKYSLGEAGFVSQITVRCAQDGESGTVTARCSIYADSGGVPGALLGTTQEHQVTSASYVWEDFTFASPVQLAAGTYWLSFNTGHTGVRLLAVRSDTVTSADRHNSDSYSGGDSDPFGSASSYNDEWCIYATYSVVGNTLTGLVHSRALGHPTAGGAGGPGYPGDVTITFENYNEFGSALSGYYPGPSPRTQAHTQAQTFPIDSTIKRTGSASIQYMSWAENQGGYDVDPGPPERLRTYMSPPWEPSGPLVRDPTNQEVWWAWSLRFPNAGTYCYTTPPDFSSYHISHPNYWGPMSFEPTGGLAALRMEIGGGRIVAPNEYPGLYGDFGGINLTGGPGCVTLKGNDPEQRHNGFQEFVVLLGVGGVRPFTKNVWHDFIMRVRWNGYVDGILELKHREESGPWELLYSNVAGSGALIQHAPHPTCVWNTQHGEQGETGQQYPPSSTKVWLDYQMYRPPSGGESAVTWGLWCDNLLRRSSEAAILAYLPNAVPVVCPGISHSRQIGSVQASLAAHPILPGLLHSRQLGSVTVGHVGVSPPHQPGFSFGFR